ncbi:MAG: hypothetical protein M3020_03415 [Myxococcota bacterium]|nr:hypothetical protein [Myxococcota bacterium]
MREKYPDAKKLHQGEGPNTLDNVYENGSPPPKYIVAESKGGSATNSSSRAGENGDRYQQGTPEYLDSSSKHMAEHGTGDEKKAGKALQDADPGEVEYIEVKQPLDSSGNPSDIKVSKYGDSVPAAGST